jgi:hypothetical protein
VSPPPQNGARGRGSHAANLSHPHRYIVAAQRNTARCTQLFKAHTALRAHKSCEYHGGRYRMVGRNSSTPTKSRTTTTPGLVRPRATTLWTSTTDSCAKARKERSCGLRVRRVEQLHQVRPPCSLRHSPLQPVRHQPTLCSLGRAGGLLISEGIAQVACRSSGQWSLVLASPLLLPLPEWVPTVFRCAFTALQAYCVLCWHRGQSGTAPTPIGRGRRCIGRY